MKNESKETIATLLRSEIKKQKDKQAKLDSESPEILRLGLQVYLRQLEDSLEAVTKL